MGEGYHMQHQQFDNNIRSISGFSILEVLISIGILSIVATSLLQLNVLGMRANKSNEIRSDLADVKRTIVNTLNCAKTFADFGTARPISCTGKVDLKDKNGNVFTNSGKIGAWTIEALCESKGIPAVNGLSIYATQTRADGSYKSDPLRNIPLNKSFSNSALFNPEVRLCADYFADSSAGAELKPLYGARTGSIVGVPAINSFLKKGIDLVHGGTNFDSQLHRTDCSLSSAADMPKMVSNQWCQNLICAGFFKTRAIPMQATYNGGCGIAARNSDGSVKPGQSCVLAHGQDVAVIAMGCMWEKEEFDAAKE